MPDERLHKESLLWRTTGRKALSQETLQKYPQSLSEGFRHTNGVLETDCTGAIKVARSHQQRSSLYEKKIICEAERKRRECKTNTNGTPADSMTLTCSTCNRQYRARIGAIKELTKTHKPIQEIMMIFLICERRTTISS